MARKNAKQALINKINGHLEDVADTLEVLAEELLVDPLFEDKDGFLPEQYREASNLAGAAHAIVQTTFSMVPESKFPRRKKK